MILLRFTADTWRRLAPSWPRPEQSTHPGCVHVVQHNGAHETQAILMADAEAADWLTVTAAGQVWPGPDTPRAPGE